MPDVKKKSFFDRIQTLFSTNVIVRNIGGKKLKVIDTAKMQSSGNPYGGTIDRYRRLSGVRSKQVYNQYNSFIQIKQELYYDYENMDTDAIISSALDIYADEATTKNVDGDVLAIRSDNTEIKSILHNLFYDILNIEYNLWPWTRNLCKYGDMFLALDIKEKVGIINVTPLSAYEVNREDGQDTENLYLTRFTYEGPLGKSVFENYEMAHFRLIGDTNFLPLGKSIIEGGRKIHKMLCLLEDAMLIHRIMRAPEKRVFKIDVGNLPPSEIDQYMEDIKNGMKKVPLVDPNTGQYNIRYNMQNLLEDFYIPQRGSQQGNVIETLPGLQYQAIEDVDYVKEKLFAALKVPKSFLGYTEGLEGKATAAQMDIRFARTIERVQRVLISELTKMAIIHLYAQGYEDADLVDFELSLTSPSIVYEQEKVALLKDKVDLAKNMMDSKLISRKYIYKNVFNMSESEMEEEMKDVIDDVKQKFRQNQIENEGNDPAQTNESYGTKHDLAEMRYKAMYGGGSRKISLNEDDDEDDEDKSAFGDDPLGRKALHKTFEKPRDPLKHNYRGNSPLSLESLKKNIVKELEMGGMRKKDAMKVTLNDSVESKEDGELLNENNIIENL